PPPKISNRLTHLFFQGCPDGQSNRFFANTAPFSTRLTGHSSDPFAGCSARRIHAPSAIPGDCPSVCRSSGGGKGARRDDGRSERQRRRDATANDRGASPA